MFPQLVVLHHVDQLGPVAEVGVDLVLHEVAGALLGAAVTVHLSNAPLKTVGCLSACR